MKLRLALIATAIMALVAPFAGAQTFCNQTVIDQAHAIRNPQAVANAAHTLIAQGANVHVVTVNSASFQKYGQLAGVEQYLESQCPSWTTNGTRAANLFVVMVAPNDRAKNIFLGSYYAGSFDVPSTYSNLANSFFKNGDFGGGIVATLQGTTQSALSFRQRQFQAQQQRQTQPQQRTYTPAPVYTTTPTQNADSGISGLAIFGIVVLVVGVIGLIAFFATRSTTTTTTTTTTSYDDTVYGPASGTRSYAARAGAPGVSHTTIIDNSRYDSNGNLLTGVLLGEALSRNNNPSVVYEQAPTYVAPTPSYVDSPAPVAPVTDAPDSTWDAPAQQETTSFEPQQETETTSFDAPSESPSYEAPSNDSGWGGGSDSGSSTDFGSSSGGDSGF